MIPQPVSTSTPMTPPQLLFASPSSMETKTVFGGQCGRSFGVSPPKRGLVRSMKSENLSSMTMMSKTNQEQEQKNKTTSSTRLFVSSFAATNALAAESTSSFGFTQQDEDENDSTSTSSSGLWSSSSFIEQIDQYTHSKKNEMFESRLNKLVDHFASMEHNQDTMMIRKDLYNKNIIDNDDDDLTSMCSSFFDDDDSTTTTTSSLASSSIVNQKENEDCMIIGDDEMYI